MDLYKKTLKILELPSVLKMLAEEAAGDCAKDKAMGTYAVP